MNAQAMASAASMASTMKKTISPHEGPLRVACEWAESSGGWGGAPEGKSLEGCIPLSVRRRTPCDGRPAAKVLSKSMRIHATLIPLTGV
jgi:hypothetical protein